jgi:curli biogenesis system outer membrane secretion channel CsgG
MKKLAVIAAAFLLSTALVVIQAEASVDYTFSQAQKPQVKISHPGKSASAFHGKHKKQKTNQIKAHFIPSFISEQAKENTPAGTKEIGKTPARIVDGVFHFGDTEALFKSNAYAFILKTRK